MTYRIVTEAIASQERPEVAATRDDLFSATSVYLDAEIDLRDTHHVYLQEQEPETMQNRGWTVIRSSKIDRD